MTSLAPEDLFFREVVERYLNVPRLLPRAWLTQELMQRLGEPGSRFVLLTAQPGAGKSGFVAQLAADHPDWLVFFIRRDQVTSMGESDARSFLLRTGFQLAAVHPELFDLEQVRIEVTQRIGAADENADVVGAEINRIYASPFHRTVLRIQQEIKQASGSVAGVRIGEWISDPRLMDLADLQEMALFGPARILRRLQPDARIVILVDALDELRFNDQQESLLEWLANCPSLPQNVRIVLTSRPSLESLAVFKEKRRGCLATLGIEAGDQRVIHDIRRYAGEMLGPNTIADALSRSGRSREDLFAELCAKANGNIGYLAAIGRAFDQALAHAGRRELLDDVLSLSHLPDTIQEIYAFFLRLIRNGPGKKDVKVTDPNTRKNGLVNAWEELYYPILRLLAVCLSPLTSDQILVLTGTFADRSQLANAMEWLDQFLERAGNTFRLYHSTLADFLVAASTRSSAGTSGFFVDSLAEHRRLAGILEGDGWSEINWQDTPEPLEQGRRDYARRHYIAHLFLAEDWDRLYGTIDDGRYGRGKLRFDPSTFLFFGDLQLAIRAVSRAGLDDGARLEQFPRLWRYSMLRSSLTSNADDQPDPVLVALCLLGRPDEAEGLARLLSSPERQALAYASMAEALASRPAERDRALSLLLQSCSLTWELADVRQRGYALHRIQVSCRAAALSGFRDRGLAEEVLDLACWHAEAGGNPELQVPAILFLNECGAEPSEATENLKAIDLVILASAHQRAEQAEQVVERVRILHTVSRVERMLGRTSDAQNSLEAAVAAAGRGEPEQQIRALVEVAWEFISAGNRERALTLLCDAQELHSALSADKNSADPTDLRTVPILKMEIGIALGEAGDWEGALAIASGTDTGWASPMAAAVRELCRRSDWDRAMEIAAEMEARERQAIAIGHAMFDMRNSRDRYSNPDGAFLAIIEALAAAGQIERAVDVSRGLTSTARSAGLALAAAECGRRGIPGGQALLAEMNTVFRQDAAQRRRTRIWPALMDLYAAVGAFDQGIEAARRSVANGKSHECLERLAISLAEAGRFDEALNVVENIPGWRIDAALAVVRRTDADRPEWDAASGRVVQMMTDDLAAGRSPDDPDETEAVAMPLIKMADLLIRRREYGRAASVLFDAVDALNRIGRFRYQPTPRHLLPASFARAKLLPVALRLMNQITDPFDRTCGLLNLAEVIKGLDADVIRNMIEEAFRIASGAPKLGQRDLWSLTVEAALRIGRPELVDAMVERIPTESTVARAQIAATLAVYGEVDRTLRILAEIPGHEPPPWQDFVSQPYAELARTLLRQGDLDQAEALLSEILDKQNRVSLSTALATALVQAGRTGDAVSELISSGELWESDGHWDLDWQLRDIAASLRDVADSGTSIRHVEKRWRDAATWEQLARSFCWAHAVIMLRPEMAAEITAGFRLGRLGAGSRP